MRTIISSLTMAVLLLPGLALAIDAGVNSTTLFRFEERSAPGFDKQRVIPATQFLGVEMSKLADGNLSFHLYGWGRADLADRSTVEGTTDGDLSYAYLGYRFPKANGLLKAGRFFVYEGVAAEQLDGVSARADLPAGLALSLFGGAPVKLDRSDDNKGDYLAGGRFSSRLASRLELGVSALREGGVNTGGAIDPVTGTKTGVKNYRELVGGDIWLSPHREVELNGHTNYNLVTSGVAEHSYLLTVRPVEKLTIAGDYNEQRFKDYFASTNLRSLFNPENGDKLKSYGGIVTVTVAKPLELSGDYKRYNRDNLGNSNRYGGELRLLLVDNKFRSGLSYHRSDATAGINSYHELRGYGLYDAARYFASLDGIAHLYQDKIYGKDRAYEVLASLGFRIMPNLAVSGDLSYGDNPQYTDEVRGLLRVTYNFTHTEKAAAKKGVKK